MRWLDEEKTVQTFINVSLSRNFGKVLVGILHKIIPMAKNTHGSRATPIPISNRKRPTPAKMATAGGNLF